MATLLAIGTLPDPSSAIERPETEAVRRSLSEPAGVLWVHGDPGSGKTWSAALALAGCSELGLNACRVRCSEGYSLEELLDAASTFLLQVGDARLQAAMEQRIGLGGKVAALLEALRRTATVLWIDDFDLLEDSIAEAGRDPSPLGYFLRGVEGLGGSPGRAVIVSRRPPPRTSIPSVRVGPLSREAQERLWAKCGGPSAPGVEDLEERLGTSPLEVRIVARAAAKLRPEEFSELARTGASMALRALEAALVRLSPLAAAAFEAWIALWPNARLSGLREVLVAAGGPETDMQGLEVAAEELESWGLVERAKGEGASSAFELPRCVREWTGAVLKEKISERCIRLRRAAGLYFRGLAARSKNPFHRLIAWREFTAAGSYEEAYEEQRNFVGEFLRRGYLDLASWVLRRTAETASGPARAIALGNLAITYKNSGDLARALDTYEAVRAEFEAAGDLANLARVFHQIGNIHYLKNDAASATAAYERSLEISRDLGDLAVRAAARIQLANIRYQAKELDRALAEYLEALSDSKALGSQALCAIVALQIAQVCALRGKYLEAETYLSEAQASAAAAGDLRTLVKVAQAQGLLAARRREYEAARNAYLKARRNAEELGDSVEVAGTLVLLGDLERASLQPKEALAAYIEARAVLGSYAAEGSASEAERRALEAQVSQRIEDLAQALGQEAFQRLLKRLPRGSCEG